MSYAHADSVKGNKLVLTTYPSGVQLTCVSILSLYNDTIVPCSCGCKNSGTKPGSCVDYVLVYFFWAHLNCWNSFVIYYRCTSPFFYCRSEKPHLASIVSDHGKNNFTPLVQCTDRMCPVGIYRHVKLNYKDNWRVKITITNFN